MDFFHVSGKSFVFFLNKIILQMEQWFSHLLKPMWPKSIESNCSSKLLKEQSNQKWKLAENALTLRQFKIELFLHRNKFGGI